MAARFVVLKKQKEKESPLIGLGADAAAPMPKRKRRRIKDDGDDDDDPSGTATESVMADGEVLLVPAAIDLTSDAEAGVSTTKRTRRRIVVDDDEDASFSSPEEVASPSSSSSSSSTSSPSASDAGVFTTKGSRRRIKVDRDEDASSTTLGEVALPASTTSSSSASQGGKRKEKEPKEEKEVEQVEVDGEGTETIDPKYRVFGMINKLRKEYLVDVLYNLGSLTITVLRGKRVDDLRQLCRELYERSGEVVQLALQKKLQEQKDDHISWLEQRQNKNDDDLKRHLDWIRKKEDLYALTKRILVPGVVFTVSMSGTNGGYLADDDPCPTRYICSSDDSSSSSIWVYQELQCRVVESPARVIDTSLETVKRHSKKRHLKTLTFYKHGLRVEVLRRSCFWYGIRRPADLWQKELAGQLLHPRSTSTAPIGVVIPRTSSEMHDRWFAAVAMDGMRETARLDRYLELNGNSSQWIAQKEVRTDDGYVRVDVQITEATLRDMKAFGVFVEGSSPLNALSTPHDHFFHSSLFHKALLALVREFCL